MTGYLLDTNILSYLSYPAESPCRLRIEAHMAALAKDALVCMSAISWGEIEYGWRFSETQRIREKDREAMTRFYLLKVSRDTGEAYAEIKARLFEKYAPQEMRFKKRRVEQLKDPLSGHALGVQENDVWIAAQAFERNLVLVTGDRMHRIKSVIDGIGVLKFDDWTGR